MKTSKLIHKFVEFIPNTLTEGVIYISIEYATAIHLCACGCGNEVVTPLTPTDWQLIFNGETISLEPSIGNWNFECQSHYWITRSEIIKSYKWSKAKIEDGRKKDQLNKARYYGKKSKPD